MDTEVLLQLVKDAIGIKSSARDGRIKTIIEGIVSELSDEQGLSMDGTNPSHLLFVADYSAWRFEHPGDEIPRHLKFRLHNLTIHSGGAVL